jgi:single-stranded-DNA-specific exonuclease
MEGDVTEASRMAAELDHLNRERQALEQTMLAQAEAEALAALGLEERGAVVVTAAEGWHPGVVGLIAARLKEKFSRPAFAIALDPAGIGTGSGRSIAGVDIGKVVRRAVAQGGALAEFRAYLEETLAADVEKVRREDALLIDGAVSASAATPEMIASLMRAGPFGSGNPEPVFALPAHSVAYADPVGQGHVRVRFRAGDGAMLNAIAFRAADKELGKALLAGRGQSFHAAGYLVIDRWQGAERVQLRLVDLAAAGPQSR